MKKILSVLLIMSVIGLFFSCEEELRDPKLDMSKTVKPSIIDPASGSAFLLSKENADSVLHFKWSHTKYDLTNLESIKYVLQMDVAGNSFSNAYDLVSSTGDTFAITVSEMNKILIGVLELDFSVDQNMELRVRSFLNDYTDYSVVYSDANSVTFTLYDDQIYIKPIYLIGDATAIDWDNTKAIPMEHMGSGRFARVEYLDAAGDWLKFLSVLGQWAPQWGTDATGTLEAGPLVYRPDEATPDPPSIPMGTTSGNYYVEADTLNLTYKTFLTSGELYLIGDATSAGWDNMAGLQMSEDPDHVFTIVTNLSGSGVLKFLEVPGQWAPQWGTNDKGNSKKGLMVYRPTESVPDPPGIPGPTTAGEYKVTVDLTTMKYLIEKQ